MRFAIENQLKRYIKPIFISKLSPQAAHKIKIQSFLSTYFFNK